ncbi:hypothetical protein NDU88_003739 [Pleurodeles waltl]|uniref:Uncharacterized protein n=1 Tax=Pleurodeles waltl TaxID=8319 RepID=A0AAV7KVT6_PLEWA|nr:hypothetical protein NDU88_003739 [Pleurodeles waltl]
MNPPGMGYHRQSSDNIARSLAGAEKPPVVINAAVGAEVRFPVQIPDGFETGDITWLFEGRLLVQLIPPNKPVVKERSKEECL